MYNPAITINGQYLKDLSYENPKILDLLASPMESPPGVGVEVEINARSLGETVFEVTLNLRLETRKDKDSEALSILELAYAGVFTLPEGLDDQAQRECILISCPTLLFPFVRSLVSLITKESGLMPITLSLIDFSELYRHKMAQDKDASSQAVAS